LTVDRTNAIFINKQSVRLEQVEPRIREQLRPDHDVIVAADDASSHGVVVQAMLAARRAGAEHFLIAVHRE
jgi:biopolymer transport protein ExbD